MQSSAKHSQAQRRLILIRHAKAVEEDVQGDHARALAPRGLSDATALGAWLAKQGLKPDVALCSTATRTRQTLGLVAPNVPTILADKLYLAGVGDMLAAIHTTDEAVETLLLVCHNPGAHGLLAHLVGDYANEADADKLLLKFPTSACAVMDFHAASWEEVSAHSARLALLRY